MVAQCVPQADIVTTTPAQGYEFKDIEAEDGGQRVRFESDDDVQVSMQVTCSNGRPSVSTRVEGDDDDDDDSGEG